MPSGEGFSHLLALPGKHPCSIRAGMVAAYHAGNVASRRGCIASQWDTSSSRPRICFLQGVFRCCKIGLITTTLTHRTDLHMCFNRSNLWDLRKCHSWSISIRLNSHSLSIPRPFVHTLLVPIEVHMCPSAKQESALAALQHLVDPRTPNYPLQPRSVQSVEHDAHGGVLCFEGRVSTTGTAQHVDDVGVVMAVLWQLIENDILCVPPIVRINKPCRRIAELR